MKTICLAIGISCLAVFATAQEKGASPIQSAVGSEQPGVTRAVVVGISDYQDDKIPDLNYANKDAEAFAYFLQSPAGGSLNEDQLKLMMNAEATTARFGAALDWLIDESGEGDQAIIYFSGHGDVETKTRSQQGFLLCWDSPAQTYISGAYPVFFLKEVVATLSVDKKVKTVVIIDACRSGKLAGSEVDGPQLTNANLALQFANEIKILSCQPDEFSIEGEQWGGGHGAFSYHLIDGLYGLADNDSDSYVNLKEIRRYLEDRVTSEVAPLRQTPQVQGNSMENLFVVVPDLLAKIRARKEGILPVFYSTDQRGIEETILVNADTTVRKKYRLFKKALESKAFLKPEEDCADYYFSQLIEEPKLIRLHATMRRNYAAALQDEAQQAINAYLLSDSMEIADRNKLDLKYFQYPDYLARAAELLGPSHYMYHTLLSRQFYFEALTSRILAERKSPKKFKKERDSLLNIAKQHLLTAFKYDAEAPFLFDEYGNVLKYLGNYEEALLAFKRANEISPKWLLPHINLGRLYHYHFHDPEKAKHNYEQAIALDPTRLPSYIRLYWLVNEYGGSKVSGEVLEKAYQIDSTDTRVINMLGHYYVIKTRQFAKAEKILMRGHELNPNEVRYPYYLGRLFVFDLYQPEKAKKWFSTALDIQPEDRMSRHLLSYVFEIENQLDSAIWILKQGEKIKDNSTFQQDLGRLFHLAGEYRLSEKHYEKALEYAPKDLWIYRFYAIHLAERNETAKAISIARKGISLIKDAGPINMALGIIFQDIKQVDSSIWVLEQALEKNPFSTWYLGWVGLFYQYNGNYEKAKNAYRQCLDLDPSRNDITFELCRLLANHGLPEEAMAVVDSSIQNFPENNWGLAQKGYLLMRLEKWADAEKYFEKVISADSTSASSIFSQFHLGELLWRQNRKEEAITLYQKLVKTKFEMPEEKARSAIAHHRLGDDVTAETVIEKWIEAQKSHFAQLYYEVAAIYAAMEWTEKSLFWLEKLLDLGFKDHLELRNNQDFWNLKNFEEYQELLKKYFPEKE